MRAHIQQPLIGLSWALVVICCYLLPLNTEASKITTLPLADQKRLTHLLKHDCGSCHGLTLKGGLGPALLSENMQKYSIEALTTIILHGIPDTPMPPWKGLLSSAEASFIANLLKTPNS